MSEPTTVELRENRLQVQLSDAAEKRAGIDDVDIGEGDDDRWVKVLATFVQDKKSYFIVAVPWVPEKGEPQGDEENWFLPFTVSESEVYASRFKKSDYKPD
jgi:hypothetical protein